jgi:hypothetical protein
VKDQVAVNPLAERVTGASGQHLLTTEPSTAT